MCVNKEAQELYFINLTLINVIYKTTNPRIQGDGHS